MFFEKGRRTERIWYYDLSDIKVGKRTPFNRLNERDLKVMAWNGKKSAAVALEWKKKCVSLKSVEYLFLDELVERITFNGWNEACIVWKFGYTSRIRMKYDKVSEIPGVELEQTGEEITINGKMVHAGKLVLERIDLINRSCAIVRANGERPASLRRINAAVVG